MDTVEITLPSGEKRQVPAGSRIEQFVTEQDFPLSEAPIVGMMVNNDVTSLTYRLDISSTLRPIFLNTREGAVVYRRSLCFLLAKAAKGLFPDRRLIIGHSLGNGYYYYFDGMQQVTEDDLDALRRKMEQIVRENLPIRRRLISYLEAERFFREHNQPETQLLLEQRNRPKVPIYECGGFADLAHAPLVPATGVLRVFAILSYPPGFLLRYPPWNHPEKLAPFQDSPALFAVYSEYKNWGKILKLNSVGRLNTLIHSGAIKRFISVAEALHDKKIAEIADRVHSQRDALRIILIAGPSSSGKTTFAKKLSIQLEVLGRNPVAISLDDYFVPRERTPRDEAGSYNFEALEAIDIELLNRHLVQLLNAEEVPIPSFDFRTGERKSEVRKLKIPPQAVLILEGIHALNDRLTPRVTRDQKYKVYVSALTQLNLDDHNRISTTDNRLLRRIVRDHQFRGHSALETLSMWQSVRNGEERHIFPFQNSADSLFNSALDYELSVLKVFAEPLLTTVKPDTVHYHEARRLLSFLADFVPLHPGRVPQHSILREFIGESGFKY